MNKSYFKPHRRKKARYVKPRKYPQIRIKSSYGICLDCENFGTKRCPTSQYCLALSSRPYFVKKKSKSFIDKIKEVLHG